MVAIESIYDAAFDRRLFPDLLESLVRAFGATSAFIGWSDVERGAGFQAQYGNDPLWLAQYIETYNAHDILMPILQAVPEGVYTTVYPHLQKPDIRESIFYREYLAPQGIVDNMAVNLIKRDGMMAHIALLRMEPAEPFSPAEGDRLLRLVPHLKRAIYIQSRLIHDANSAEGYRQGLAGTTGHVMLLTAGRQVVELDPELATILKCRPGDILGNEGFGAAVATAIAENRPAGFTVPGEDGEQAPFLCEARALVHDRFGDLVAGEGASHAVHVSVINRSRRIAYPAIGTMYRLTPTEIRVMQDAVDHSDLLGIGDRLGMARATARTHLHRIYDKTRSNGLVGLSNLAHRFVHAWIRD